MQFLAKVGLLQMTNRGEVWMKIAESNLYDPTTVRTLIRILLGREIGVRWFELGTRRLS